MQHAGAFDRGRRFPAESIGGCIERGSGRAGAERGALYLDTCIEPWAGGYVDPNASVESRSNYTMRLDALKLRNRAKECTHRVLTHGANPGLVSHLVKQALMNIAKDNQRRCRRARSRADWAKLARRLGIKVIHIAERDTQVANIPKEPNEFVNTCRWTASSAKARSPPSLDGELTRDISRRRRAARGRIRLCHLLDRPGASTRGSYLDSPGGHFHGF